MNKKELKNNEKFKNKKSTKSRSNLISNHQPLISDHKAITLIALVITIIVMLILVGVTVTIALNGGLFTQAKEAVSDTKNAVDKENELSTGRVQIGDKWYNSIEEYTNAKGGGQTGGGTQDGDDQLIDTTKSYVGYYADVNGDGTEDGIIYADLAVARSGQWNGDSSSSFSWTAQTDDLKQYEITKKAKAFGDIERNVITAVDGSGTKDRFYVMALDDVDDEYHYWYNSGFNKLDKFVETSYNDFGEGKENTKTMIGKWESKEYGNQDPNDMWGIIQGKKEFPLVTVTEGKWFVPSKSEWAAFGWLLFKPVNENGFGVDSSNYTIFDLKGAYWSSTSSSSGGAYAALLDSNGLYDVSVAMGVYVRLSATF